MDSAPLLPTNPPPCDEDYARSFREQPAPYVTDTVDSVDSDCIQNSVVVPEEDYADGQLMPTGERSNPKFAKAYHEALDLQQILLGRIKDPEISDSDRAKLVLAWDKLEDRKRILRGRPLPGSLTHSKPEAKPVSATIMPFSSAAA